MPAGLTKWTFVIVAGVLLAKLLQAVIPDPEMAEKIGFIVEPLPILICWGLELFAADDEEEEEGHAGAEDEDEGRFPMTWARRLLGVPALVLCVYLVLG